MWALQDDRGLPVPTPASLSLPCPLPPSGQGGLKSDPCLVASSPQVLRASCLAQPSCPVTKGPGLHCQLAKGRYPSLVAQTLPI